MNQQNFNYPIIYSNWWLTIKFCKVSSATITNLDSKLTNPLTQKSKIVCKDLGGWNGCYQAYLWISKKIFKNILQYRYMLWLWNSKTRTQLVLVRNDLKMNLQYKPYNRLCKMKPPPLPLIFLMQHRKKFQNSSLNKTWNLKTWET